MSAKCKLWLWFSIIPLCLRLETVLLQLQHVLQKPGINQVPWRWAAETSIEHDIQRVFDGLCMYVPLQQSNWRLCSRVEMSSAWSFASLKKSKPQKCSFTYNPENEQIGNLATHWLVVSSCILYIFSCPVLNVCASEGFTCVMERLYEAVC